MPPLLPFNPRIIHPFFFSQHSHPMLINFGDCFRWAWIAYKLFQDVQLWSTEYHAFIQHENLFYDSECLSGTKPWRRLRTVKDTDYSVANKMSPASFQAFWSQENEVDWSALNVLTTKHLIEHQ